MDIGSFEQARILIVDDDETNIRLLVRLLGGAGYTDVVTTTDPGQALSLFLEEAPDLVILDLNMPFLDGFQVMEQIRPNVAEGSYLPILVQTGDESSEAKERALTLGAKDFVTKPFDRTEILLRVKNLLETRSLHVALQGENVLLEAEVGQRTASLQRTMREVVASEEQLRLSVRETVERLSLASEMRDDGSGQHVRRMSHYAELLAAKVGMDPEQCELIRLAAQMHDVGKAVVPDSVLLKPGPLDPDERAVIQTHAEIGHRILSGSRSELMQLAATIALTHHEKVDGSGYPNGLVGDQIPVEGKLVAIADVFDALSSDRAYRKAMSLDRTLEVMREGRGTHFDAGYLDVFLSSLDEIVDIGREITHAHAGA